MNKSEQPNKRTKAIVGMVLLGLLICSFIFVGINGIIASANMPFDDGDQRDLGFFISLYGTVSIIAFGVAVPLTLFLIAQVVQYLKGKNKLS